MGRPSISQSNQRFILYGLKPQDKNSKTIKGGGWALPKPHISYSQSQETSMTISSVQLLSHVRLCDSMNCSMPSLPVHHQLPEFTQTHVHRVGDAIHPSYPLLLLPPIPPSIRVFSNESALHIRWPKYSIILASFLPKKSQG